MSCHGRSTPTSLDPSIVVIVFMLTFFLEIYLRFLDFCESLLLARRECNKIVVVERPRGTSHGAGPAARLRLDLLTAFRAVR